MLSPFAICGTQVDVWLLVIVITPWVSPPDAVLADQFASNLFTVLPSSSVSAEPNWKSATISVKLNASSVVLLSSFFCFFAFFPVIVSNSLKLSIICSILGTVGVFKIGVFPKNISAKDAIL